MEIGALLAGKYRLVRLLGDGGMGAVYEARHEVLGTSFAVKILHADLARRPGLVDRFLREAHVAAQIKSPHVVQVFDVDRTPDGTAYIVMELLGGEPLSRVLDRERRLPVPIAIGYASQILEALEAAHVLGVVHRDLKPENVFVVPGPTGTPLLKLIDFGIAKLKSTDPAVKNLTAFGVVMGTPEYMAPEQAFSADRADARSDIYAVGVMLYEMLVGARPATGEDAQSVAGKVHRGEVVPLVHAAPHVPRELAGLVHRAMAPRPELRFQSASDMLAALHALGQQHGAAQAGSGAPPAMPSTSFAPPIPSPAPPDARLITGAAGKTAPPDQNPQLAVSPAPPHYGGGYTPPPRQISYPEGPPPRRKKRSAIAWIIAIPLLLGAAVAAVVLALQQSSPSPPPIVVTPTPTTPPTQETASTPTTPITTPPQPGGDTLPPLVPGSRVPPSTHPSTPSRDAGGATASADGGAAPPTTSTVPPPIFPFPSTLPSALPFPLPSAIPLPSGFPPIPSAFPFPPGIVPQPQPAPSTP